MDSQEIPRRRQWPKQFAAVQDFASDSCHQTYIDFQRSLQQRLDHKKGGQSGLFSSNKSYITSPLGGIEEYNRQRALSLAPTVIKARLLADDTRLSEKDDGQAEEIEKFCRNIDVQDQLPNKNFGVFRSAPNLIGRGQNMKRQIFKMIFYLELVAVAIAMYCLDLPLDGYIFLLQVVLVAYTAVLLIYYYLVNWAGWIQEHWHRDTGTISSKPPPMTDSRYRTPYIVYEGVGMLSRLQALLLRSLKRYLDFGGIYWERTTWKASLEIIMKHPTEISAESRQSNNTISNTLLSPASAQRRCEWQGSAERNFYEIFTDSDAIAAGTVARWQQQVADRAFEARVSLLDDAESSISTPQTSLDSMDSDILSISDSTKDLDPLERDDVMLPIFRSLFREVMEAYARWRSRQASGSSSSQNQSIASTGGSDPSQASDSSRGRKRAFSYSNESGAGSHDKPGVAVCDRLGGSSEKKLLACPFWKRDRRKYRPCGTKVLKKISYVKQHLYRDHAQPDFYCQRCYEVFLDQIALSSHTMAADACTPNLNAWHDSLTQLQQRQLHGRPDQRQDEAGKWFTVWGIVFPGHEPPRTPYIDTELSEDLSDFLDFLDQEGPDIIANHLRLHSPSATPDDHQHMLTRTSQAGLRLIVDVWTSRRSPEDSRSRSPSQTQLPLSTGTFQQSEPSQNDYVASDGNIPPPAMLGPPPNSPGFSLLGDEARPKRPRGSTAEPARGLPLGLARPSPAIPPDPQVSIVGSEELELPNGTEMDAMDRLDPNEFLSWLDENGNDLTL